MAPDGRARGRRARATFERLVRAFARPLRALTVEGRVLFVASMLVGASGLDVDRNHVYWLWSALAGLLVASLIARRWYRLEGAALRVEAPRRVTVGEPTCFSLSLENGSTRPLRGVEIEGPRLPELAGWRGARPRIAAVEPSASARAEAICHFGRRGELSLSPFLARARTPFGLAFGPPIASEARTLLVVPRLAPVRRITTREGQRYQPGGVALASKTGESMELLGVRPYRAGDALRDLHARSWAKTGTPVVREYQQEYFSRVGVVLDTDASAGSAEGLEAAVSLAAGVVASLSRGEALIDLLVVGDRVHPLTLGRSLGFLDQALDLLACVEPGPAFSSASLLAKLEPFLPRLMSVVIVTERLDAERGALAQAIRERGTATKTLVIGATGSSDPDVVGVTIAQILGEEPLLL